ncbi:MAG: hypothetical protein R3E65_00820 [Steroidobacteraceae bacterium]
MLRQALLGSLLLALFAGCASQADTAARVVAETEQTLQALRQDAADVVPEEYAAAEQALGRLRTRLEQRDFAAVVAAFPAVTTQLASLQDLAAARRVELAAAFERARGEWGLLSIEVPASLDALQRQLDQRAAAGKPPAGLPRETLTRARETLAQARAQWSEALASFSQGRLPQAADQARASRETAAKLAAELAPQAT